MPDLSIQWLAPFFLGGGGFTQCLVGLEVHKKFYSKVCSGFLLESIFFFTITKTHPWEQHCFFNKKTLSYVKVLHSFLIKLTAVFFSNNDSGGKRKLAVKQNVSDLISVQLQNLHNWWRNFVQNADSSNNDKDNLIVTWFICIAIERPLSHCLPALPVRLEIVNRKSSGVLKEQEWRAQRFCNGQ